MASDQKSVSQSRRIIFKSKGGSYSAIFMSDKGDLFQEYEGTANSMTGFHPQYSESNPANLYLTVTSSRSTGTITPTSVTYTVAGIELAFNASGACTTTTQKMNERFRLKDGVLQVIGNLADIAQGAGFIIQAEAKISAVEGTDTVVAHLPVSVSPYVSGSAVKVTIAPGDTYNFTIGAAGNQEVVLRADIYDGDEVASYDGYSFKWYQLESTGWKELGGKTSRSLTVSDEMVNTYSDFKVEVTKDGVEIGSDTQGVLDASDPLDIVTSIMIAASASATPTDTADETLTDDMDSGAYLLYVPKVVRRGDTAAIGGVAWDNPGFLVSASGLKIREISLTSYQSNPAYKISVQDLLECGGVGEYEFVFGGSIA